MQSSRFVDRFSRSFLTCFLILGSLCMAAPALALQFRIDAPNYTHTLDAGNVDSFQAYATTAMGISGFIETSGPFAPNLDNDDLSALLTGYEVNDGVFTYTPANSAPFVASVWTDGAGVPTKIEIALVSPAEYLQAFLGSTEYSGPVNAVYLTTSGYLSTFNVEFLMSHVGVDSLPDDPFEISAFAARAQAECAEPDPYCEYSQKGAAYIANQSGDVVALAQVAATRAVPTLSQWMLALLLLLVGGSAMDRLRRRPGAA